MANPYYSGHAHGEQALTIERRLLDELACTPGLHVRRRKLQTRAFGGAYYFPGDTIAALRRLQDRGLVSRHPFDDDAYMATEAGRADVALRAEMDGAA